MSSRDWVGMYFKMVGMNANGGGGEVEARSGATVGIHPNHFEIHPNPIPTGHVM